MQLSRVIPSSRTAISLAAVTDAMIIMMLNYFSQIWTKMVIPFKSGQVVFLILLQYKKISVVMHTDKKPMKKFITRPHILTKMIFQWLVRDLQIKGASKQNTR